MDRCCDPHLDTHELDDLCANLSVHLSGKKIVDLTMLIGLINDWNRLAISLASPPPP